MNPTRGITVAGAKGMVLLLALALASYAPAPATPTSTGIPQATKQQVLAAYGKLPLSFEANEGQADPQVKFLSRGSGYTLFLTTTEAVLTPTKANAHAKRRISGEATIVPPEERTGTVLRMKLLGANPMPRVTGVEELRGRSNYFIGNDPAKWRTNIPTYGKVRYQDLYPGIDVVYYGNQQQLEFDFIVAPGADPQRIRLGVEGADGLDLDAQGDLVVHTGGAQVRLQQPHVYQMAANGVRQEIKSRYVLNDHHQVEVWVAAYDTHKPLVIDPTLAYSTYLGGNSLDEGFGIAVDGAGNAYVTGATSSSNFPTTTGAFQPVGVSFEGQIFDAFVTKLDPTGEPVYSTFLGGLLDDSGIGIAVDAAGNAYVTGQTRSPDFPTTEGAFQRVQASARVEDAFVTKLNPTGAALIYSTYLGGTGSEEGTGIAVDGAGNAYVVGITDSINFPTTSGAFQGGFHGGFEDAFVTKLDPFGATLVYSTYLGGTGFDEGEGIAVDTAGNAYVTGLTLSTDFPASSGAFQPSSGGGIDAFVTKLDPFGSALVYSTYLGGTDFDEGDGIAVDAAGNAYVTGLTFSTNFPTTTGAFKVTFGGVRDAFVTKLGPTGAALVYSTYLGGSGEDSGFGIAVDSSGNAYVTGDTFSADFPTTAGAFQTTLGGVEDAFVTKFDSTGVALFSTFLGGSSSDFGFGIAVDAAGNAYVTGETDSSDFLKSSGAFQASIGGISDAFVTKFGFATINTPVGTNVVVQPVDATSGATPVTVTFANVTQAGNTTLTTSSAGPSPPTPSGFKLGTPPTYYDLTTTASFTGLVTACINYTGIAFANEASLKLFHFVDPNWVDATVSLDTATQIICGRVTSLSPFAIVEPAIEPFAAFHARVEIEHERHEREFEVKGTFTLGAGSNGIHPLTEDVTIEVGAFAATIPKGSFRRHGHGTFKFEGVAGGARLEMKIQARGGNRFEFKAEGKGAQVGTAKSVTVRLAVGDDAGNTVARVKADDD